MAGDAATTGQQHLQPAAIAIDSEQFSRQQWISFPGAPGNCCKTQYRERRYQYLHPANIGSSRCLNWESDYPPVGNGFLPPQEVSGYIYTLTRYNEGYLCAPHCTPPPSPTPRPRPTPAPRP